MNCTGCGCDLTGKRAVVRLDAIYWCVECAPFGVGYVQINPNRHHQYAETLVSDPPPDQPVWPILVVTVIAFVFGVLAGYMFAA